MTNYNDKISQCIDQTLGMNLNPRISLRESQLEIKLDSELELFFLKKYLIDNVFGYNYREFNSKHQIILTNESSKNIIIYNRTACLIFFNHINFNYDVDALQDFEDQPFIYVKSKNDTNIPVIIITDLTSNRSSNSENIRQILAQYYENAFKFGPNLIDKMLSVTRKSDLNDLVTDLKSDIHRLKSSVYIVYHLFSNVDRSNRWEDSDSYQEIFTIPGKNKYGQDLMKSIYGNGNRKIPSISTAERLKLKKNLDKMFDSQLSTN